MDDLMQRFDKISAELERMQGVNVLVIGDIMVDEYLLGTTERISPEAPVPVVDIRREQLMLGGAGNVVRNLVSLGARVFISSVVGAGSNGRLAVELFEELGINIDGLIVDSERITSKKTRILAVGQQVLRIDRETRHPISETSEQAILDFVGDRITGINAVILSDYAKGVLTTNLIKGVIALAKHHNIPVLVDPKGTDYSKYRGATLVTPNEREAEAASHFVAVDEETLVRLGNDLMENNGIENLVITRSEKGMIVFPRGQKYVNLPTRARQVYDVTGAGDTVISTLGLGLAAGIPLVDAAVLANVSAGIVVGKVGTSTTTPQEMLSYLEDHAPAHLLKVKNRQAISETVRTYRAEGKRIVFTNGCFDLMHVGHIIYLQKARHLGDVLILGLNSDDSVRRIKGEKRPLMGQEERAHILAALDCVDDIIIFEEDTPLELLKTVRPDVLVKGGDYSPEEVVGRELVQAYGGSVEIIPFVEGKSTTNLINNILERYRDNN